MSRRKTPKEISNIQLEILQIERNIKKLTFEDWEHIKETPIIYDKINRYDKWKIGLLQNFAPFPINPSLSNSLYNENFHDINLQIQNYLINKTK